MKTTTFSFALLLSITFSLSSCSEKYKFWNVEKFNMQNGALTDSQKVKIIYYSAGPEVWRGLDDQIGVITTTDGEGNLLSKVQPLEFYVQYLVFDIETKDSFNILSYESIGINEGDKDQTFYYTSKYNSSIDLFNNIDTENLESLKSLNVNKEAPELTRVARDPEFDFLADNTHPTVIGRILRAE